MQCVDSRRYKEAVQLGVAEASGKRIRSTPTFVVGRTTQTGVDGELVVGAVPLGVLQGCGARLGRMRRSSENIRYEDPSNRSCGYNRQ